MSYERSGNRGELVGHVLGFEPEPGFVPRDGQQLRGTIELELDAPVDAGDSLELRHASEPTRFLVVVAPRAVAAGERVVVRVARRAVWRRRACDAERGAGVRGGRGGEQA